MRMSRTRRWVLLLGLAVLVPVFSLPNIAACAEKPLWELGVGLAALQLPDYRGSDENRFYLLPYPYFIYRGDIVQVDQERVSGRIFKTDKVLLDISLYGQVPVKSSDNDARTGMPDLDPTFEVGPSLNITLLDNRQDRYKLNLDLPVRPVFSTDFRSVRYEGWVFSPRLAFEKTTSSQAPAGTGECPLGRSSPIAATTATTIRSTRPMPRPRVPNMPRAAVTTGHRLRSV